MGNKKPVDKVDIELIDQVLAKVPQHVKDHVDGQIQKIERIHMQAKEIVKGTIVAFHNYFVRSPISDAYTAIDVWLDSEKGQTYLEEFKRKTVLTKIWTVESYGWEHGNTLGMFRDKEDARKELLRLVKEGNESARETHGEYDNLNDYILVQDTEDEDHWFSSINHYCIFEREIK